jgi:hypothetical protein
MQNGQILSTKKVGEERTRSRTLINGTGQVSLSTETRSNNTSEHSRTYAAGPMQVSEVVALGGGEYDGWLSRSGPVLNRSSLSEWHRAPDDLDEVPQPGLLIAHLCQ